jgi:hypothetical protein
MTITVNGTTTNATCVDRVHFLESFGIIIWINCVQCLTCTSFGLDFTKGFFEYFAGRNPEVSVIHGSWSFIDVSEGGNNSTISRSGSTSAHLASQTANVGGGGNDSAISSSSGTSTHLTSQTANAIQKSTRYCE